MQTKLAQVREHMTANRWRAALRIAARFPRLGREREAILDAHTAYTYPHLLQQLGKDLDQLKAAGEQALRARFGK